MGIFSLFSVVVVQRCEVKKIAGWIDAKGILLLIRSLSQRRK
jgi:hypothetical protein